MKNKITLECLGWNKNFIESFKQYEEQNLKPFRVTTVHKDILRVKSENGEFNARISGKARYLIDLGIMEYPVVGDWIAVKCGNEGDELVIQGTLPRMSYLARQSSGRNSDTQIISSNIDYVFIVTGLDRDFNLKRIERYLTIVQNGGSSPIILLNKSDICEDSESITKKTVNYFPDYPVITLSALTGTNLVPLDKYLIIGKTIALIGSSGCGKSTLLNQLLKEQIQSTGEVREGDGRGRHTTTVRSLHVLKSGGVIIDNPGLREIQLTADESGLNSTFEDIDDLSNDCKFRDCSHQGEPGCAVQKALLEGDLEVDKFLSYLKLKNEVSLTKEQLLEKKHKWEKQIALLTRQLKKRNR